MQKYGLNYDENCNRSSGDLYTFIDSDFTSDNQDHKSTKVALIKYYSQLIV